ncbi:glycosyltransferase [bacterium]|nr:MAG: glycosyltransferase [bacterium]
MSRLRVLHVIQSLRGYGAERQIATLLPLLRKAGVDAAALAVYSSGLSDEERAELGYPVIELGRRARSDYSFPLRFVREIKRFAPDVVHTHMHVGKYWGRMAAMAAGVPIVVHTEHNPCDIRRSPLERLIDPMLSGRTACVVTFLEEQREVLASVDGVAPGRVAIIPNGVAPVPPVTDEQRVEGRRLLGVRDGEYAALLIGRLEYQKNQALALRALAALAPELRGRMRLALLGAGSEGATLRALTSELGLESNVAFLGYRSDVAKLLPGADLVLMTSRFEGMPLTLIEAMLAGVPIVTTPWIGARSMLGDGTYGVVTIDAEPRSVAAAVAWIMGNAARREAVAERARAWAVQAYDIQRMAEAYRSLYVKLVEKRPVALPQAQVAAL